MALGLYGFTAVGLWGSEGFRWFRFYSIRVLSFRALGFCRCTPLGI